MEISYEQTLGLSIEERRQWKGNKIKIRIKETKIKK